MAREIISPVIELHQVKKHYGTVQALKGIDITIRQGETVAVLGPNGAGKTTTISLMLGLRYPDHGHISVFGKEPRYAHARIGAMLQESGIPLTLQVREVIELFRRMYPHPLQTQEAIDLTDLGSKATARISTLSGGQRQRLYFALAVIGNPDLLFLDEPTVGMDVESRQVFWERMREQIADGKTIILTTHNLEEADALASRVIVINQGQIVAEGTTDQIKQRTSGKHIRFHSSSLDKQQLIRCQGVQRIEQRGDFFDLVTEQPDATFAQLTALGLTLADVEIMNGKLEEAFLTITANTGK